MKAYRSLPGLVALAVVTAGLSVGVSRALEEGGPGVPGEGRFQNIKSELGLTDEQAEQLRTHLKAQRDAGRPLWEDLKAKREALRAQLQGANVNEGAARSLAEQLKAAHGKVVDHRLNGILGVRKILTAEQFAKWQAHVQEKRQQRRQQWGGQGKGGGAAGDSTGGASSPAPTAPPKMGTIEKKPR